MVECAGMVFLRSRKRNRKVAYYVHAFHRPCIRRRPGLARHECAGDPHGAPVPTTFRMRAGPRDGAGVVAAEQAARPLGRAACAAPGAAAGPPRLPRTCVVEGKGVCVREAMVSRWLILKIQ